MDFAISQPKILQLPWKEKQTYQLNPMPQMWPSHLTLAMTLTLNCQGQIWQMRQKPFFPNSCKKKFCLFFLGHYICKKIPGGEPPDLHLWHGEPSRTLRMWRLVAWCGTAHDLDLGFSRSNWKAWELVILDHELDLDLLVVTKVRCKDLSDNDWGDFRYWRWLM